MSDLDIAYAEVSRAIFEADTMTRQAEAAWRRVAACERRILDILPASEGPERGVADRSAVLAEENAKALAEMLT